MDLEDLFRDREIQVEHLQLTCKRYAYARVPSDLASLGEAERLGSRLLAEKSREWEDMSAGNNMKLDSKEDTMGLGFELSIQGFARILGQPYSRLQI